VSHVKASAGIQVLPGAAGNLEPHRESLTCGTRRAGNPVTVIRPPRHSKNPGTGQL
jgi:hypothetical protein